MTYPIDVQRLRRLGNGRWAGVGGTVYALGLTSLLTDISSEMVASVLPLYLVFGLRLTPLQFGFVDGLYQGAAAVARLAGGLLADRWRRNRDIAAAGYGLSAICKLGLIAAGGHWGAISAVIGLDRFGKGLRTAPRDALISRSSEAARLGLAFGVHRALDTAGALLGPLVGFGILALMLEAYDVVFVVSFCFAVAGLAALLLFVREPDAAPAARRPSLRAAAALLQDDRSFRRLTVAGSLLGLVTVGDAFFYLMIQRSTSIPPSTFPLLYVATALTFLLLAIPAGRFGDRVGRGRVFLLGHVLLVGACMAAVTAPSAPVLAWVALALLGAYYACTDGVLMAAASAAVPEALRASGLALLGTATGLARLLASVLFGATWETWGLQAAFALFAAALALVALATSRWWLSDGRPA